MPDFKCSVQGDDLLVEIRIPNAITPPSPLARAATINAALADAAAMACGAVDDIRAERAGLRTITTAAMPSITQAPNCPGCGTSVAAYGDVCAVCRQKPQFAAPPTTIQIGKQPDPAYLDTPSQAVIRG